MNPVQLSALDDISKEKFPFGSKVWDQQNMRTAALDLISSGGVENIPMITESEGKYLKVPLDVDFNPNAGVGTGEQSALPAPGSDSYLSALYQIAEHSSAFRITQRVQDTITGGAKSVVNALDDLMRKEPRTLKRFMNWYCHRDGSGELAKCGTTSATNVVQLDTTIVAADLAILKVGMEVVLHNRTTGAYSTCTVGGVQITGATALVITAISLANKTATVLTESGSTPVITTTSADGLFRFDSQGQSINGFGNSCTTTNPDNWGSATDFYGAIDRTTTAGAIWQAQVLTNGNNGATSFTLEDHVQPMLNKIDRANPDKESNIVVFTGYDAFDSIALQLTRDQRTGRMVRLKQKYDAVEYQNATFVRDRDAPVTKARFVDVEAHYRLVALKYGWDDQSGAIWRMGFHPLATSRPVRVYRADARTLQQMLSVRCCTNGEVTTLTAHAA